MALSLTHTQNQQLTAASHINSDNGDRASLQNVCSWLNTDRADCLRRFQNKTLIQFAPQIHLTQYKIF
jgi:hypothetical protein